jgi:hypothetical protein
MCSLSSSKSLRIVININYLLLRFFGTGSHGENCFEEGRLKKDVPNINRTHWCCFCDKSYSNDFKPYGEVSGVSG